MRDVLRGKI